MGEPAMRGGGYRGRGRGLAPQERRAWGEEGAELEPEADPKLDPDRPWPPPPPRPGFPEDRFRDRLPPLDPYDRVSVLFKFSPL
jgi:hypothetical protein